MSSEATPKNLAAHRVGVSRQAGQRPQDRRRREPRLSAGNGPSFGPPDFDWRTGLPVVIWSSLIVVTAVLLSRRLVGGFSAKDGSVVAACLTATVACLLCLAANLLYNSRGRNSRTGRQYWSAAASLGAPFLLAVILLPYNSTAGVCYLAVLFLFVTVAVVMTGESNSVGIGTDSLTHFGRGDDRERGVTRAGDGTGIAETHGFRSDAQSAGRPDVTDGSATEDGPIAQWTKRTEAADGGERVEGTIGVQFAAGQRQAIVHVAFVPPLADSPTVECEILGIVSARTRVTTSRFYGARIEIKRGETTVDPAVLQIAYCATTRARRDRAA